MQLRAFAVVAAAAIAAAAGVALLAAKPVQVQSVGAMHTPVWTEFKWPFPPDLWGPGLAFHCRAADCGTEVYLYLRAKLGFCNCLSSIDDEMVDQVGDVNLLAGKGGTPGSGRPIDVRWMHGRSRDYEIGGRGTMAKSVLSMAFHDRCDLIVATAAIGGDQPSAQEQAVLKFLNGERVLGWLEKTLGL